MTHLQGTMNLDLNFPQKEMLPFSAGKPSYYIVVCTRSNNKSSASLCNIFACEISGSQNQGGQMGTEHSSKAVN